MGRRSGEFGNQALQFLRISLGKGCGAGRIMVNSAKGNDAALVVFRNACIVGQVGPGVLQELCPIDLLKIEPLDQPVFERAAA